MGRFRTSVRFPRRAEICSKLYGKWVRSRFWTWPWEEVPSSINPNPSTSTWQNRTTPRCVQSTFTPGKRASRPECITWEADLLQIPSNSLLMSNSSSKLQEKSSRKRRRRESGSAPTASTMMKTLGKSLRKKSRSTKGRKRLPKSVLWGGRGLPMTRSAWPVGLEKLLINNDVILLHLFYIEL